MRWKVYKNNKGYAIHITIPKEEALYFEKHMFEEKKEGQLLVDSYFIIVCRKILHGLYEEIKEAKNE